MANNRINRYIGAIALGSVLAVVPGCTDTWDDHYNDVKSDPQSELTLWEQISSNPKYSRFADILQHAKYYKDNTHAVPTYTYKDVLNGGQVNTVWVPDNDVLTQAEYQKWLDMCNSGSDADGFNVQQQFLGNHIALWRRNISGDGVDTVKMINGKNLEFNKTNKTFAGLPLGEVNTPAINGVLHTLKGIAPFRYNFYETLKYTEPRTKFGDYVVGKDTTYFMAGLSIEGLPDENGRPTYVDSAYVTSNRLFEFKDYLPSEGSESAKWPMKERGFGAQINNEDSVFVMIMLPDAAWDAAYEKLKASHIYAPAYEDKSKGDLGSTAYIKGLDGKSPLDVDSLQKVSILMDLVSPLVFNIHQQPKIDDLKMWTLEEFKQDKGLRAKYLLNTYGDTLRSIPGKWDKESLFEGEPIEMSNGIAYNVASWNFPSQYYTPDVEVEIENTGILYNQDSNKNKLGSSHKKYSFSNDTFREITNIYGHVSNNNFYHLDSPGATAVPKAEFKLFGNNPAAYVPNAQVMSGKYDIQVVVVPHWYMEIAESSKINPMFLIPEKVDSAAAVNKYKFRTQICYNQKGDGNKDRTSSWVTSTYEGKKVDTITVATDFEFPFSYKNMRFSYPTLIFEGATSKTDAKNGFVYDVVIDKIILRRKD